MRGILDPEQVMAIYCAFVFGGGLGGLLVSLIAGFARDAGSAEAEQAEALLARWRR